METMMSPPTYNEVDLPKAEAYRTATELLEASNVAAQQRCLPLLNHIYEEIDGGVASGLRFINARVTLALLQKYSPLEQSIFIKIITETLTSRDLRVEYNGRTLYVIWDIYAWNITMYHTSTFYHDGKSGVIIKCKGGTNWINTPGSTSLHKGDVIVEINGKPANGCDHRQIRSMLFQHYCVNIKVYRNIE
jgi:hypothetical protein